MKLPEIKKTLFGSITQKKWGWDAFVPKNLTEEEPLRDELFSLDQLERHAARIASNHPLLPGRSPDRLLPRLTENEQVLEEAYSLITNAVILKRRISPASEWLLDNFYFIEEQIRSTRRLLPRSYSGELPRLATGTNVNYPRAYAIALEIVAHTDGRVDAASLNGFVSSYQSVVPLKLGELWALPLMLRLALIENLRRVAVRIAMGRRDRDIAVEWAERMISVVEQSPTDLILVLADMARAKPSLSGAFLSEFTRHLQGQNPSFAFANSWVEQRLADQGQTTERMVQANGQEQAADQVSIGNSITSLRFLSTYDWRSFVADQSLVEQTLCRDPAGAYLQMDFATRDRYRHAVEAIAKRSQSSEYDVANRAIQLAKAESIANPSGRTSHVGYYLVDHGRPALERLVHMRLTFSVTIEKIRRQYPLTIYLFHVLSIAILASVAMWVWSGWNLQGFLLVSLVALPILLTAVQLGIGIANLLAAILVRPQTLPKMDFEEGIPSEFQTLIAVPTMLSNASGIESLLEKMEIRYLANRDLALNFALLTDFEDAKSETMPADAELLRQVVDGVELLNQKYGEDQHSPFCLLHRPRLWNQQENVWMGYERKRGKLADLNATLRGARDRFQSVVGSFERLSKVRYVITLDSDTQLPRDAAREMIGAMAHPLNRPVVDLKNCRIVDGYTILQPRVGVSLPSSYRSWFVRLFGGDAGIDPYTRVVSDLYQDLFGEGSFIGKGIYDVDSFENHCSSFPENAILSHDLLESCYCRSALLSDVVLYEDFPSSHAADVSRRHRWTRGDWQIAAWILPRVRGNEEQRVINPISALSRWKILDNLRRSLVPVSTMILLLFSWLFATTPFAIAVTGFVLFTIAIPSLLSSLVGLASKPSDLPIGTHLATTAREMGKHLLQSLFSVVFLPYDAMNSIDAIVRTLIRVHWSRRRLLEWKTSSDSERTARSDLASFYRSMMVAPLVAVGVFLIVSQSSLPLFVTILPILGLWSTSPAIAWWLSRPFATPSLQLSPKRQRFLRAVSRKTWRYFETYVNAEENWLPPDNVQFNPIETIASRTSPTNIGMALLSDLAAVDFGYCTVGRLIARTELTFHTLSRMERYRGHFFNWYDTRSLAPMMPRYLSTVDSGNLVGHLLVLGTGMQELISAPVLPPKVLEGLSDTLSCLLDAARQASFLDGTHSARIEGNTLRMIERQIEELERLPRTLTTLHEHLPKLAEQMVGLRRSMPQSKEIQWWISAVEKACQDQLEELRGFAAWIMLPLPEDGFWSGTTKNDPHLRVELKGKLDQLDNIPSLVEVAALGHSLGPWIEAIRNDLSTGPSSGLEADSSISGWLAQLHSALESSSKNATERIRQLEQLSIQCSEFAEMDFTFLLNKSQDLFAIGYNATENRLDSSCYDLLASEARLVSFILVAQGELSQEHWFTLGRLLTSTGGESALLSWSGSMFEYLMPLLVMPTYEHTLLDQTYRAIVHRQISYGRQRGVAWGISESGYNTVDLHLNYQYRAFGVPGLGLKRGLADDLVIAPYASAMGLMIAPDAACRNLERLAAEGREGPFGFFEAIDYTPSRLPPGVSSITVRQFMAHHAGMSLLSMAYVLLDKPMQRRFGNDPMFRAADLLLHERIPKNCIPVFPHAAEASVNKTISVEEAGMMRVFSDPNSTVPEVHLLSNGSYHVAVTSAGGGYSRWRNLAVTRWREDTTRDCWGNFCYLRDLDSGVLWSTALHPTGKPTKAYEAIFTQARAEFRHQLQQIETHTQISVSTEDDMELRRTTITNRSDRQRTIEVTSYAEVVIASQAQDESHPAFSNLFVQTEILRKQDAILCTRRPRSAEENPPWMIHMMTIGGVRHGETSFETDRTKFIGRGRNIANPIVFDHQEALSDSEGSTLDPVVSIRRTLLLQPNESIQIDIVMGVAETRATVVAMADKYADPSLADRVFELAWTRGPILLQQLNASESDAQAYGRLAGSIIYGSSLRRAKGNVLIRNHRGQSGLWGYGISGDLPIVLLRIRDIEKIELVRQAVQAHAYWRMKGLSVDLVIWNEDDSVYRQSLQESIMDIVAASPEASLVDRPGGVFVRRGEQMSEEDRVLLQTVARVVLMDDAGSLIEQVERRARVEPAIPLLIPSKRRVDSDRTTKMPSRDLAFFNGLGGFSQDGREYVTTLEPEAATPAPWVNVIANAQIGFVVSESGGGYTWTENSHEFRLTPWTNDPVTDTCGEAIYIRDEETGRFWSPSPLPARGSNTYVARHGFGYSIFDSFEEGISTELCMYVAVDAPVKFARLRIVNRSGRPRQLSITGYWEWVLGELRSKSMMYIITESDPVTGAIFARNPYSHEFSDRVAFVDCSETVRTFTGDRKEFLGRNGSAADPAALHRTRLSNRVGGGLDPCGAIQSSMVLDDGEEKVMVFTIGSAVGEEEARKLVLQHRGQGNAQRALEGVWHYWSQTLGVVNVETPDAAVNFLANGWLVYQTLACRMWGRTGFYQSGGAYGFRDQLQDAMALIHAEPMLLREHLLRAAAHQFREGDVQHWWHPPFGRGVRTHFSDDYLWLPLAICRYVLSTGDTGILDEKVPFLSSRSLRDDEESNYDLPQISEDCGTLYEHAIRAVDHSLRFGEHGLPLMGCGDWNDGMNLVGQHGKGESVWLAFFLYDVLMKMSRLALQRGEIPTADRYTLEAGRLRGNIEQNGWDGNWYRRAYFDDGTPLGSSENEECQIDSISQSWSVLSGAGTQERSVLAMESADQRLVRRKDRLIQLLDPPFDHSNLNPGYIKGYVPGVRENGGQYTHAAIWTVMAFAEMGEIERAWECFGLINPILHGATPQAIAKYRVEPYVVAADVYGVAPHIGRGGWTWYTGSSGWMYRMITETLLGLQLDVDKLRFVPRPPKRWPSYKIHYRFHDTFYHITIQNGEMGNKVRRLLVDGNEQADHGVLLINDHGHHEVFIELE